MSLFFNHPEIEVAVAYKMKHSLSSKQMHLLGWHLGLILRKYPHANLIECANRYMIGKRAITLPFTRTGKQKAAATRKSIKQNRQLIIDALGKVDESLKQQYIGGKDKVLNAIVGKVLAITKLDPAAVKQVVIEHLV